MSDRPSLSSNLRVLPVEPSPVNETLVKQLEALLEQAKSGEITNGAFACQGAEDSDSCYYKFTSCTTRMLVILKELEWTMLKARDEE